MLEVKIFTIMTLAKKTAVRSHFTQLMKRATRLDDITSRQTSTDPKYQYLLEIFSLQSGLPEEIVRVDSELNYFLN